MDEKTRSEWRDLGFFYEVDETAKLWAIIGSRAGLLRFVRLLNDYVADLRNATTSEHEHYGPYMSLKVMTWPEPDIDSDGIRGSLADLARLAALVERCTDALQPGGSAQVRDGYAPNAQYALEIRLRDDDFDPASADPYLGVGVHRSAAPAASVGLGAVPEVREVFRAARRYLDGKASIHELNGVVGYARSTASLSGSSDDIIALLDEWSVMVNRRWNEWGEQKHPLSEDDFARWLREQLL